MRLLVDNQLPPALASWPRDQGHDAVHVADAGLERLDDGELWLHAVAEERIVVSKDEDFLYLASLPPPDGCSGYGWEIAATPR